MYLNFKSGGAQKRKNIVNFLREADTLIFADCSSYFPSNIPKCEKTIH